MKDVVGGTQNIAKQLNLITTANRQHSAGSTRVLARLTDVRSAIEGNARSAKDTRDGTNDLARHVEALAGALGPRGRNGANGRA